MKQATDILEKLRNIILSTEFCNRHKINPKDFIRKRVLTLQVVFFFILNLPKRSIAIELLNFTPFLSKDVSKAAITKARVKLSPRAFIEINQVFVKDFYTENKIKTFYEFTVIAIDGSLIELPLNTSPILEKYGATSNQTDSKKPMTKSSSAFDVLNGITLDAILAPYKESERNLAIKHIQNIKELNLEQRILLLLDRGYPSLELIMFLTLTGVDFVMRSNSQFLKEVNDVVAAGKQDATVKLCAGKLKGDAWETLKQMFPSMSRKTYVSLRVLLVPLNTGEIEILLTSLLDKTLHPYPIFKELYFKRWQIEEEYDFKKNSIEIENFSGKSCIAVEQDFHAAILIGNIQALLIYEAHSEMKFEEVKKDQKYNYKINKNVGLAILKTSLIEVLIDPETCLQSFCRKVKLMMRRNLIPERPGRSYPRKRKHLSQKYQACQR